MFSTIFLVFILLFFTHAFESVSKKDGSGANAGNNVAKKKKTPGISRKKSPDFDFPTIAVSMKLSSQKQFNELPKGAESDAISESVGFGDFSFDSKHLKDVDLSKERLIIQVSQIEKGGRVLTTSVALRDFLASSVTPALMLHYVVNGSPSEGDDVNTASSSKTVDIFHIDVRTVAPPRPVTAELSRLLKSFKKRKSKSLFRIELNNPTIELSGPNAPSTTSSFSKTTLSSSSASASTEEQAQPSFLSRYWIYIAIAIGVFLFSGEPPEKQQQGQAAAAKKNN